MATGSVSWGQRKALGKRYAIDPAIMFEQEKINQQYALAPGREARALQDKQFTQSQEQQASQFNRSLGFQYEQARLAREVEAERSAEAAKAGMVSTGVNALSSAATVRALTMKEGTPFLGKTVGGLFGGGTSTTPTAASPALVDAGATSGGAGLAGASGAAPALGGDLGATAGMGGAGEAASGVTAGMGGAGEGAAAGSSGAGAGAGALGTAVPIAAAAIAAAKYGMPVLGKALGAQSEEEYKSDPSSNVMDQAANITAYEWDRPVEAGLDALGVPVAAENTVVANLINPGPKIVETFFGGKGGTVICTELNRQGLLSDDIRTSDAEYRDRYVSDAEYLGYRILAAPVVWLLRKSPRFTRFFAPYAIATAKEMASRVNLRINGTMRGKTILAVMVPICGKVGAIARRFGYSLADHPTTDAGPKIRPRLRTSFS